MKTGKNKQLTQSYRPISLTSVFCKTIEKFVNNRLKGQLDKKLSAHQYGFRQSRNTIDSLTHQVTEIHYTILNNETVTSVFFELEKAFDTISRERIFSCRNGISKGIYLISLYLHGRTIKQSKNRQYPIKNHAAQYWYPSKLGFKCYPFLNCNE